MVVKKISDKGTNFLLNKFFLFQVQTTRSLIFATQDPGGRRVKALKEFEQHN